MKKSEHRQEWTRSVCKFDVDSAVWKAVHTLFKDKGASMGDQIYLMEVIQEVFDSAPIANQGNVLSFERKGDV